MKIEGNTLVRLLTLWVAFCNVSVSSSQNIVPNPSFEDYKPCPTTLGQGGALQCQPWKNGSQGTCDYFNACAPVSSGVNVPENFQGIQFAHFGEAYTGLYAWTENSQYREYILVHLTEPMELGFSYHVNFWVSLAEEGCATTQMGAYFSVSMPYFAGLGVFNVTPQVTANIGFMNDTEYWMLISGCYVPVGGEEWIVIGNFSNDVNTPIEPGCNLFFSYYYIDDVSVVKGGPPGVIDFDLGGPVTECNYYVIDPGLGSVVYHWGNGSSGPTLLVTESGTYALTVTSGCDIGVDSIDVTILGSFEPVEIGPAQAIICNGDSYDISLDPNDGDYEWQDGSTDPEYSITSTGVYTVSLDDGCDITTDEITVIVLDPPSPFTLGPDAILCTGETIEFSFDPSLGNFQWQNNSTASNYTITTAGVYALTISNMCGEVSDEIEITSLPTPAINLGAPEVDLCPGGEIDLVFNPDLGQFLWQDGSVLPSYLISIPGTYSVTVTNVCGNTSDQIIAVLINEPVFDLGSDIIACPAQLPITLDVSNATNATSFHWQNGSSDPEIEVNSAGIYSVTVSNSCFSISDDIEVEIQDASPVVTLPADQILCAGESITLDGNGLAGNYQWQDGSTNSTFLVNQQGTYSLTVTNECGSGSDQINVQYINDLSPPDLGADINLCPGEQYILYAGVAGVNYSWQDLSTADSFLVSVPGEYFLQISNTCSAVSDTVIVSFNASPPLVDLPTSLPLCSSDTISVNAAITGVQFLWNDGSQSSTLSVSSPGIYSLTVSNACGADVDSVSVIDAGPPPSVSLGLDISFCSGDANLIAPVSADVISWLWQDGSTGSTFSASTAGIITVEVNNSCGVSYDTLIASLLPPIPLLQLGADTSLCPGEIITLSINETNVDILWSDGSGNSNLNVTSEGTFFASISNQCGSSSDSVDISFLPPAPVLDLGVDQSLCPGDVITLSPGITGVDYLWQDGSMSSTFTVIQSDSIILTISNSCGFDTDTIVIIENSNGPQVDLGPDILECEGTVVTIHSGIFGVNYLWQDGSTSADFTTSVSGTFILQVSNSCGIDVDTVDVDINGVIPSPDLGRDSLLCEGQSIVLVANEDPGTLIVWQDGSNSLNYTVASSGIYSLSASNHCGSAADTIEVEINGVPPLANLGRDTILCDGQSIMLFANADAATNIVWQDGSSTPDFNVTVSGLFFLSASNHCGFSSDTIDVGFETSPGDFNLGPDTIICPGQSIVLTSPQTDVNILWQDGSHGQTMIADQALLYFLQLSNSCGIASDSLHLGVDEKSPSIVIDDEIPWCEGDSITLDAQQSFFADYLWNTGSTASSITVYGPGLFGVTVFTSCQNAEQQIEIVPGENCNHDFYIPTVFSPNGDNVNDFFSIFFSSGIELNAITCSIFDRWGNMVYNTKDPSFAWDGRFKNDPLNPGVYVYRTEFTYSFNGRIITEVISGDVTLIR